MEISFLSHKGSCALKRSEKHEIWDVTPGSLPLVGMTPGEDRLTFMSRKQETVGHFTGRVAWD